LVSKNQSDKYLEIEGVFVFTNAIFGERKLRIKLIKAPTEVCIKSIKAHVSFVCLLHDPDLHAVIHH
jgi:hypothetical protein